MTKYLTTIGLEFHAELKTRTKIFCSCPTDAGAEPNTHVCPTCLGMPGSRPVLNKEVLVCGIKLAKMLGCTIADETWFSRKTYFYPDMSKSVSNTGSNGEIVFEVRVADGDMGKVIGRQGRIVKQIRILMRAVAQRKGKKVSVEILD